MCPTRIPHPNLRTLPPQRAQPAMSGWRTLRRWEDLRRDTWSLAPLTPDAAACVSPVTQAAPHLPAAPRTLTVTDFNDTPPVLTPMAYVPPRVLNNVPVRRQNHAHSCAGYASEAIRVMITGASADERAVPRHIGNFSTGEAVRPARPPSSSFPPGARDR